VAQPLPLPGDRLLLSAGYGVGSKVIAVAGDPASGLRSTLVWETPRLKSKFASMVWHGGFVYGLDDGVLTCLDPANGERRWKAGRYGHGQIILLGDLLFVQTEEGEAVLVDPTPEAHRELARATLLDGKTWNPPAFSGARLLVRNDREAALYEMPLAE
jgi:outer membrane protein assembly factor BamB